MTRPYRTDRTTQLHIRLSPDELAQIQAAAASNQQSVSDYIRSKVMDKPYNYSMYDLARIVVENDPDLMEHADFILADWPEGDEHWRWVVTASRKEILDWVAAGS